MRILLAAMGYDVGRLGISRSYEYYNFYEALQHIGHDVTFFEFDTLLAHEGRALMNERLADAVKSLRPDLLFAVLHTDEIDPGVVEWVSRHTGTVTLNWFCDDQWRFDTFSRFWAPRFTWVATTSRRVWGRYRAAGIGNAILTQWACNQHRYSPLECAMRFDVTFVGQAHGHRRYLIREMHRRGLPVKVWGRGWRSLPWGRWYGGPLSHEGMVRLFNETRVNLNFSNSSIEAIPGNRGSRWQSGLNRVERALPTEWAFLPRPAAVRQLKGRTFEIPGAGGFLLTEHVEELEEYYSLGREVVSFQSAEELIDCARFYLAHDAARRTVARAGYERTLRDHTYERRFADLFRATGLVAGARSL
jgi:spore maturation protein CgeB